MRTSAGYRSFKLVFNKTGLALYLNTSIVLKQSTQVKYSSLKYSTPNMHYDVNSMF